jgi:uncharacterized protein YdeI (BOF family)
MTNQKQKNRRARFRAAMMATAAAVFMLGSAAGAADKENITLRGVVTRNPVAGYFVLRADNGWTYRVDTSSFKPENLTTGDRVRAYGDWDKGVHMAGNVRVLRHGTLTWRDNIHPDRTIIGTVKKDAPGNDFVVQARNNWTYLVRAKWGEPDTLSAGDRVRVYGNWRDGMMHASNVRLLYDASVLSDTPDGVTGSTPAINIRRGVTRSGTVTQDLAGNNFTLRGNDGVTYHVRALRGESATLSDGDRVRVFGNLHGAIIDASNVRIAYQAEDLDPDPYDENRYDYFTRDREKWTLNGTVLSNPSGERFTMRARNGYTYAVRAQRGEPSTLTAGDRVRVYGAWRDGLMQASNVRLLREGENPKNWATHTWVGVVTENPEGDRFVFRLDNGISYRVLAVWGEPDTLSVGDRVRAYGTWRTGMLHASNVRVLREG